jgi:hypothetical protein
MGAVRDGRLFRDVSERKSLIPSLGSPYTRLSDSNCWGAGLRPGPTRYSTGLMNAYAAEQTLRQAVAVAVLLIVSVVILAMLVGLGWLVWEYLIDSILAYSDPEPPAS